MRAMTVDAKIGTNRRRAFVGRRRERRCVAHWIKKTHALTKIVAVTGLGGIGKSTFLAVALQDAEKLGARVAWVDGRACFGSPQGVIGCLPPGFIQWLRHPDDGTKWILGIDNYDALRDVDGWLRHDFFAKAPRTNLLVLVCERQFPLRDWQLDLGWTGRVEQWALEPFTTQEVTAFLNRRGIESAAALAPVAPIPLTLAIYADLYQRGLIGHERIRQVREALSASLLREVLDDAWQEAIDVLCLVSAAHLDFLNAVIDTPISPRDYQRLAGLSFVTPTENGLALHDMVRGELRRDLRHRQPQKFDRLRRKIVVELATQWYRLPDFKNVGRIAHDLVQLVGQDLGAWRDYADLFEDVPWLEFTPYEPRDRRDAIRCLAEWGRPAVPMTVQKQEELFHMVESKFPHTLHIMREPAGEAIALLCLLPLNPDTMDLLRGFAPDIIARFPGHLDGGLPRSSPHDERWDTRLVTMVGMRTTHPIFPVPLLAGSVLRYTLASSSGHRIIGLVVDEQFKVLLEKLGFVPSPFPVVSKPDLVLYSLDLRFEEIPRWAARLMGVSLHEEWNVLHGTTSAALQRMLNAYRTPDRFSRLPEVQRLGLPPAQLRRALLTALEAFASHSERIQWAHLIRSTYMDRNRETRLATAARLHMSRATLHRHLVQARDEFLRFIRGQWREPTDYA